MEKALKLSKKLSRELASLRDFTRDLDSNLASRESRSSGRDVDDELSWVQVSAFPVNCLDSYQRQNAQEELSRREPLVALVTELMTQLVELAEEAALSEAEVAVKRVVAYVTDLNERLARRRQALKVRLYAVWRTD